MYPPPMPPPPPEPQRANENAFVWGFGMAVLWFPAGIAIRVATLGPPTSAYETGRFAGLILLPVVAAGLITGAMARNSRTETFRSGSLAAVGLPSSADHRKGMYRTFPRRPGRVVGSRATRVHQR